VIRACRSKGNGAGGDNTIPSSEPPLNDNRSQQGIDEPRLVTVQREATEGLGISITVSIHVGLVLSFSCMWSFPHSPSASSIKLCDRNTFCIGSDALTVMVEKSSNFWDVTSCSPMKVMFERNISTPSSGSKKNKPSKNKIKNHDAGSE
jgi:hypothetical protein